MNKIFRQKKHKTGTKSNQSNKLNTLKDIFSEAIDFLAELFIWID